MMPEDYISAAQFSKKHGVCANTVNQWIHAGRIPGAIKVPYPSNHGFVYAIPKDAVPLPVGLVSKPRSGKDYTPEEMVEYIRLNCVKQTYAQISKELGIPLAEIRRIYDQLHEAYGI